MNVKITTAPMKLINVSRDGDKIINTYLLFENYNRIIDATGNKLNELFKNYKVITQTISFTDGKINVLWDRIGVTEIKENTEEITINDK